MENQMKKTNNTYKTFFLKKHPYKKPYLKYQLTLSLQRMKFHIFTSVSQPILR